MFSLFSFPLFLLVLVLVLDFVRVIVLVLPFLLFVFIFIIITYSPYSCSHCCTSSSSACYHYHYHHYYLLSPSTPCNTVKLFVRVYLALPSIHLRASRAPGEKRRDEEEVVKYPPEILSVQDFQKTTRVRRMKKHVPVM